MRLMKYLPVILALLGLVLTAACKTAGVSGVLPPHPSGSDAAPVYTYSLVNSFPHDPAAYTEGLVFDGGFLYEGTGRYGQSSLRQVELETGRVIKQYELPGSYYGEGITIYGNRIFQLTWQERTGFIYEKEGFAVRGEFTYPGEGWGITWDGASLVVSDGSSTLHFLDPATFAEKRRIEVTDSGNPVKNLNELEFIDGQIFANVWETDRVAVINPETGQLTAWIDLTGLLPAGGRQPESVLNGIAYDKASNRLLVSAKLWDKLYEIRLVLP